MGSSRYSNTSVPSLTKPGFARRKRAAGRCRWGRTLRVEALETRQMLAFTPAGTDVSADPPVAADSINATDLQIVEFLQRADQNPSGGNDLWYTGTTTRDGYLTMDALAESGSANVQLTLYQGTTDLSPLLQSTLVDGRQRIDWQAGAGEAFFVRLSGTSDAVDLRVADLLNQSGDTATLTGTAQDDQFAFSAGASPRIVINGIQYDFDETEAAVVNFDGAGGSDTATLHDSPADEIFTARPQSAILAAADGSYSVAVANVESVFAYATAKTEEGNGGNDVAMLYDSPGDDHFVGTPDFGKLFGADFFYRAKSFEEIHAYAKKGGNDRAEIFDSPGDDEFTATPQLARMVPRAAGDTQGIQGFVRRAKFFDEVRALSTAGGRDYARLVGSDGDDTLTATNKRSELSGQDSQGQNFLLWAESFFATTADVDTGGHDVANLWGTAQTETFQGSPEMGKLHGAEVYFRVKHFDEVHAHGGGGGVDLAELAASDGDDVFVAKPDENGNDVSRLSGDGYRLRTKDFAQVEVDAGAGGGNDSAELHDSSGNDLLEADGNWARLIALDADLHFIVKVMAFDQVEAKSTRGGTDVTAVAGNPAFLQLTGDWDQ